MPHAALSPLEVASLAQAEALWTAVGPTHYTLEMRLLCFCSDPVRAWTTIEVDHDTLVAVTFLTGDSVPRGMWSYRATVSGLFRLVHRERHAFRDIQMRFDQSTGYPRRGPRDAELQSRGHQMHQARRTVASVLHDQGEYQRRGDAGRGDRPPGRELLPGLDLAGRGRPGVAGNLGHSLPGNPALAPRR